MAMTRWFGSTVLLGRFLLKKVALRCKTSIKENLLSVADLYRDTEWLLSDGSGEKGKSWNSSKGCLEQTGTVLINSRVVQEAYCCIWFDSCSPETRWFLLVMLSPTLVRSALAFLEKHWEATWAINHNFPQDAYNETVGVVSLYCSTLKSAGQSSTRKNSEWIVRVVISIKNQNRVTVSSCRLEADSPSQTCHLS